MQLSPPTVKSKVLDVKTIYYEPAVLDFARGRQILAEYPAAERIEVPSHWNIPNLHGNAGSANAWLQIKYGYGAKTRLDDLPWPR